MRTCPEYEVQISAFIDGCLPEADRAELMAHMAACPACQTYFDDQIAIHDALTDLEDVPAPADLSARVMARVRETAQEPSPERRTVPFPRWRRWAALAACCAIAAAGLWGLQGGGLSGRNADAPQTAAYRSGAAAAEGGGEECLALADIPIEEAPQEAQSEKQAPEDAAPPGDAPSLEAAALPAPALRDLGGAKTADWAGILSTASPAAGAWVEENLGLLWAAGGEYPLTEAEYAQLREILLAAEAEFDETPGQGEVYLLLADF